MDSFTAKILLGMSKTHDINDVSQITNQIKKQNKNNRGPSKEAIEFFNNNQGKKCRILHTEHEGIIHKLNTSTCGFYPGQDVPIYVKITNGKCKDQIFEYRLEQIEVVG